MDPADMVWLAYLYKFRLEIAEAGEEQFSKDMLLKMIDKTANEIVKKSN